MRKILFWKNMFDASISRTLGWQELYIIFLKALYDKRRERKKERR